MADALESSVPWRQRGDRRHLVGLLQRDALLHHVLGWVDLCTMYWFDLCTICWFELCTMCCVTHLCTGCWVLYVSIL